MFSSFLFEKLSHLKQFYSTEADFINHLMSGDVSIPVIDLINYAEEYQSIKLPSYHQIGDKATLSIDAGSVGANLPVQITAVHFTAGKVKYDVEVSLEDGKTRFYNIDSVFIVKNSNSISIDSATVKYASDLLP